MNTMQQEFDVVVAHLYKQGAPAKADGVCAYRGEGGKMCAVGVRIPDTVYRTTMEGMQADTLIERFPETLPAELYAYETMFERLQCVHDNWDFHRHNEKMSWGEWLDQEFPLVAREFDLIFTAPAQGE